ncbi:helix-turn-helix transcriptional regulator [Streptosporangium carneum]|uniref:helix-turn-helix transcriptional regulator n=1 Tax=Streptosporangium carneum TaxID=47481 RepID=UPI0022F2B37A|nr:LuxR family transcriptional regulator [Streptosporangium carneum]
MLFGRDRELKSLTELLDSTAAGRGGMAVITGPVVGGKTAVLHELGMRSIAAGGRLVRARCTPAERSLDWGVADQILGRGAAERLTAHRDGDAVEEVCVSLFQMAEANPVLLAIDDVDLADDPSLLAILAMAPQLANTRMMIAVTICLDRPPARLLDVAGTLLRLPGVQLVELPLLPRPAVRRFAAEHLGAETADQIADDLYRFSGGSPLLVRALIEDQEAGAPGLVVGDSFMSAVATCVHGFEPEAVRVAEAVAVLGEHATPDAVDELVGIAPPAAMRSMGMLARAGLLAGGRFRHESGRLAVLGRMTSYGRMDILRRAAEIVYRRGGPLAAVATHLLEAGWSGEEWAYDVLVDAGRQAFREGDFVAVMKCLRLALASGWGKPGRLDVKVMLAAAEWRVDPAVAARHLPDLLDAARSGALRGSHGVELFRQFLWYGRFADAGELIDRLRSTVADRDADASLIGMCHVHPALLDRLPCSARGSMGHTIEDARRILHQAEPTDEAMDRTISALMALLSGGVLDVAASCETLLKEPRVTKAPTWRAIISAIRAEAAWRKGDLAGAEAHAQEALTILQPSGWGVAIGAPLSTLLHAQTAMGHLDDAKATLEVPMPRETAETAFGIGYELARAHYHLVTDQPRAAFAGFQACGQAIQRWGCSLSYVFPWRLGAARACLQLGWRRRAADLVTAQIVNTAPGDLRTYGIALRLLAQLSKPCQRQRLLMESVDALETAQDRYELALALSDLAGSYQLKGGKHEARAYWVRAQELARECNAKPLMRRLAAEHDHAEAAPLSGAERRVAVLAARGHTNREIAKVLYITRSTVEQHLTRIYRKLNIQTRGDLSDLFAADIAEEATTTASRTA